MDDEYDELYTYLESGTYPERDGNIIIASYYLSGLMHSDA